MSREDLAEQARAFGAALMNRSVSLARRTAAEGLATFALVFTGCGAIITDRRYQGRSAG